MSAAITAQTRQALAEEARSWLGTPYHPHARIKGAGVDCAMLLAEVFEACGVTARVVPDYYPVDWHMHRSAELYLAHVERYGVEIEREAAQVGDLVVVKFGRTFSHGGIIVSGAGRDLHLVHAYYGRGVIESTVSEEPVAGRPMRFFSVNPQLVSA